MPSKPARIISSLLIKKLIYGGSGLGRDDKGKTIFVPMALPGEVANVRIVREKKDYAEGTVDDILTASPERRLPPCPVFGACGGCQLQHLSEEGQAVHKSEIVHEFMGQIQKESFQKEPFTIHPLIRDEGSLHYRLRGQLKVQNKQIGFYRTKSHDIVPVNDCAIMIDPLNQALTFLIEKGIALITDAYGGVLPKNYTIELQGTRLGEVLIILIDATSTTFSMEKMTSFFDATRVAERLHFSGVVVYRGKNRLCLGKDYLTYNVAGNNIRVSDQSFVQVHGGMHDLLIKTVSAWANSEKSKESHWLELHAGVGMFTLPLSEIAGSIIGIEGSPYAVLDAKFNLKEAGYQQTQIIAASVETALTVFAPHSFTDLLMDPPRGGIAPSTIKEIGRLSPRRILYLSCHPATLVRDIRGLVSEGYHLQQVQPFDLFPQTGHVEILVELKAR